MLKDQLKHAFQNFVAAVIIFVLAVALAYAEKYIEKLDLPAYIPYGVRTISVLLFIVDGIVLVGTAIIFAIKMLRDQLDDDNKNEGD